ASFGRLLRRDASLVPAAVIAVAATAFTVASPPTWLGRLPQAIADIATGERQQLQQQLTAASAESEQARTRLAETTAALATREQAAAAQQQELADLKSNISVRDAKLAEQDSAAAAAVEAAQQKAAADVEAAKKALAASEQTVGQQAETIAALRGQ